ncbi:MAG: hypothetical protein WED07_15820 [Candidatus Freyarchaeum deiterrae]
MSRWDPMANVLVYGSLLHVLDEVGVKPALIGRQIARVLAPMFKNFSQKYAKAGSVKTMEQFLKDSKTAMKKFNIWDQENFETDYSNGVLSVKVPDCMWLDLANHGKSQGYSACALCGVSVFLTAFISTENLGDVLDIQVDNNERVCFLKLVIQEK